MTHTNISDIDDIFAESLDPATYERLIGILTIVLMRHHSTLALKTRNESGQQLGFFSVVQPDAEIPVVFAGGRERSSAGEMVPAIRVENQVAGHEDIPSTHQFPYRKPGWMCVEIVRETIDYLRDLLEAQVHFRLGSGKA